ncbi:MAG: hypothetical protein LBG97_07165 [Coriobacteriales bacterium]|jgi:D-methionine transport system substrate-binding protein|nr:hypothetical protein [Coriobacteriales bacterium]
MKTRRSKFLITGILALLLVASVALLGGCDGSNNTDNSDSNSSTAQTSSGNGASSGNNATSTGTSSTKLTIGAAQVPHAEILEFIKPTLAKQGIEIEIVVPTDEGTLNQLTENGELDVNYFQHVPYLNAVVSERGFDLVSIGGIHLEPIGAYSDKFTKLEDITDNATVAITNDGTNEYRALKILEEAGFIKLKDDTNPATVTKSDIETYFKPLNIVELEAGLIVRTHDEYDLYISNTNRIIEGGLDANKFIFREAADSPYANVLVVKRDRASDTSIKALYDALRTTEVKDFIEQKYKGAVVAAF